MLCMKCWYSQMDAFTTVLNWINEQPTQYINKKVLYAAVLDMRPNEDISSVECELVTN